MFYLPKPSYLLRYSVLGLLAASLTPGPLHGQRVTAHQPAAKSPAIPVAARMDMLSRLQALAVQSGDPVQIAASSRSLNLEVLSLLATIAISENRLTDGVDLLRESQHLQASTAVQLQLSALLARMGRTDEAIAEARQAAQAEPGNARAFSTLGSALRAAGRDREAADALTRALQLDPNPSLAFALGSSLLKVHDKARADELFARILHGTDGAAIWHVAIGDAYREANYLDEAAAEFRKALALDPRATHAEFFLGLVSLQMNEWGPNSESFKHLRKSVELNPREYLSNFYLGALESTDGSDLAASDRHLKAAAAADASQPEVWIYLGQNANREHRQQEAIADLQKAVQLTGSDEARNGYQIRRAYFTLGRLLIAAGDREGGEKFLADYKRTSALGAAAATSAIAEKQGASTDAVEGDKLPGSSLRHLAGDAATQASSLPVTQAEAAPVTPQLRDAEHQLRMLLGNSYNDLGTAEARQQQYAPAQHDYRQAERFGGGSAALLRNLALVASRMNDAAEVQRALTEYFDTTPTPVDPRSRLMFAMANFDLGHFADAARNFQAAGDATMADPRTVYSDALSLARTGQAKEASALADKLVDAGLPTSRLALVCNVYFTAENYTSSAACYGRVAQQDPSFPTAHYFVAESLLHQDHPAEAIPELHAELALTPDEPNVQSALAFALSQTGHKDEAQTLLAATIATHPEHAEAQYQLGKLLAEQGQSAQAIPHLEASVQGDGSKDYAHYQLATAYRKVGRTADAEREFSAYRSIKETHRNDRAIPATTIPATLQKPGDR